MDDRQYARWLHEQPNLGVDVIMISYHSLRGNIRKKNKEGAHTVEQCELLEEDDWVRGGLTLLFDDVAKENVFAIKVDGTQELDVLPDNTPLENLLHFKTTSIGIKVGENVKDYCRAPK